MQLCVVLGRTACFCHTAVVTTALSSALITPRGRLHCCRAPGFCCVSHVYDYDGRNGHGGHMLLWLSLREQYCSL